MNRADIASEIRVEMARLDETASGLARETGLSRGTVSRVMRGGVASMATFAKIFCYLDMNVDIRDYNWDGGEAE